MRKTKGVYPSVTLGVQKLFNLHFKLNALSSKNHIIIYNFLFPIKIYLFISSNDILWMKRNMCIFCVWWHAELINEKLTINRYFYAESEYKNLFSQINCSNSKVIQPQSYFSLFNAEETQTLIISIFCMLFKLI